ncbi:MAG: hypothetical protein WCC60_15060 [Ilumatobacteraceae bacterium]
MTTSNDNDLPRGAPHPTASGTSGPSIAFIALAVVAGLAVIFFLQNSEPVFIDFWVFEKKTTIRWSILMSVLLGVLLDRIVSIAWRRRAKNRQKN